MAREIVHRGRKIQVALDISETPDGQIIKRDMIFHPGAVVILPVVDKDHICLLKNYRFVIDQTLWECPAGTLELNEPLQHAAERELLEETGYEAAELISLGRLYEYPTKESHTVYPFLAVNAAWVSSQKLDVGEIIEVVKIPLSTIQQQVVSGNINVAVSIATIFRAIEKLKEIDHMGE